MPDRTLAEYVECTREGIALAFEAFGHLLDETELQQMPESEKHFWLESGMEIINSIKPATLEVFDSWNLQDESDSTLRNPIIELLARISELEEIAESLRKIIPDLDI